MADDDVIATLIGLTGTSRIASVRIEAVRSLAAYLDDPRAVRALQALTSNVMPEDLRLEAIRALGARHTE